MARRSCSGPDRHARRRSRTDERRRARSTPAGGHHEHLSYGRSTLCRAAFAAQPAYGPTYGQTSSHHQNEPPDQRVPHWPPAPSGHHPPPPPTHATFERGERIAQLPVVARKPRHAGELSDADDPDPQRHQPPGLRGPGDNPPANFNPADCASRSHRHRRADRRRSLRLLTERTRC